MQNPESIPENETHKLLWDTKGSLNLGQTTRCVIINNNNKTNREITEL